MALNIVRRLKNECGECYTVDTVDTGQAPRCTVHRSLMAAHLAIDKNLAIFLLLLQVDKQLL